MKLFRDFLEECIGKSVRLVVENMEDVSPPCKLQKIEADYIEIYHSGTYLYIPIDKISVIHLSEDTQNSEN